MPPPLLDDLCCGVGIAGDMLDCHLGRGEGALGPPRPGILAAYFPIFYPVGIGSIGLPELGGR